MSEIEKAIKSLQNIKEYWSYRPTEVKAAELAIEALKEKLERDRGCEHCNTNNKFTETGLPIIGQPYLQVYIAKRPLDNIYFLVSDEYEEKNNIKGQYDNAPFRSSKKEIHACPMCGRKLERR